MFPRRLILALAISAALPSAVRGREVPLQLDPANSNQIVIEELAGGGWEIRTTGNDPYFYVRTDGTAIDLKEQPMFSFDYFTTTGIGRSLVFVGSVLDIPHLLDVELGSREAWAGFAVDMNSTREAPPAPLTSLRVRLGDRPGIVARVRSFRARPRTAEEINEARGREARIRKDQEHAQRLRDYLAKEFPHRIDRVAADAGRITVHGKLAGPAGELLLAEVPMWEDVTQLGTPPSLHPIRPAADGSFRVAIDRASATDRDLLLSAWAVVQKKKEAGFEPLSALHYVDEQTPRATLPPARPASLKGLGGCPFDHPDIGGLGIHSL
ncbi:hypothetical protein, partial [Luteolibacter marinus]|uniref:hypothetical protein n=1 Tax=Luteolibacter marinus TaxID=2776705 RepID=UPI0018688346